MAFYKIDIEKSDSGLTNLENHSTLYRRFISEIIKNINEYYVENGVFPKVFAGLSIVDYLYSDYSYTPSPLNSSDNLVGKLMGTDVYRCFCLDDNEYFVGLNEREIEITKRTDKINKILKR